MNDKIRDTYTPKVFVQLNRFEGRDKVLVTVIGDPNDEDAPYFSKLDFAEHGVGFSLDPVNHPHEVEIVDDTGVYGGEFKQLSEWNGAFLATPPRALTELLFPAGATEVTLPCRARSGEYELGFTLPEGRSLLSLFFKEPLPATSVPRCQPGAGTCLNQVTA